MKRPVIGLVLVGILLVWVVPRVFPPVFGQAASAQAPHIGEGGLPQFEKDPTWPKVPATWKMGFGSAVAVDEQDHVWILSRPHTLVNPRSTAPDVTSMAAPPVMEFDNAGTFSTGEGAQEHPPGHQIAADHRGNVYAVQAELTGADGKSGGAGAYKFVFKGYSPVAKCCQGGGVQAIN